MLPWIFAVCLLPTTLADPLACDVMVVCDASCDEALTPWIQYREAQGHRVCLMRPDSADRLQASIRHLAQAGKLRSVLLVGDAPNHDRLPNQPLAPLEVPTCYVEAKVNVRFGSEPLIATDNGYADLDDDGLPELQVGRLAVNSVDELATILKKIIAYESAPSATTWRRNINLIAGVGGFGSLADSLIEMSAKRLIVEGIPASYQTTMTYGSWQSPYCPSPPAFHQATVDRFNEGCLFWVYMGHGMPAGLAPLRTPESYHRVFDQRDVARLDCRDGCPIAIFLACYTCAFDFNHQGDCLAEQMLIQPKGPVAVLGATRVSMPYAMTLLSNAMLSEFFKYEHQTIGELILAAKRQATVDATDSEDQTRALLDALAASFSPTRELLAEERLENVSLFNLLGDPLTRLQYPQALSLDHVDTIRSGQPLLLRGTAPKAGRLRAEVVYRRDRLVRNPGKRRDYVSSPETWQEFDRTYAEANDRVIAQQDLELPEGPFEVRLEIPSWARGAVYVRAFLSADTAFAQDGFESQIRVSD